MATVIDRFGSAWVAVTVIAQEASADFLWVRKPGPSGPDRFSVVWRGPPAIADGVQLVWPDVKDETLTYRVGGPSSASRWLQRPELEFRLAALDTVRRCTALVMRGSTAQSPTPGRPASTQPPAPAQPPALAQRSACPQPLISGLPAPLRRLSTHLENPVLAPSVLRWRATLEESLGRSAAALLLDLVASHQDNPAFAHGGLTIGGIVPVTSGAYDCVLSGEDAGRASAGHDIGWLAGELLELRATASAAGDAQLVDLLEGLLADILGKHGEDPEGIWRAAVLRIALHSEDYARFVGWNDQLGRRAHLLERVWSDTSWASTGHPPAL